MKVLLAYLCHYEDRGDYHMSLMPVGVMTIAAYLEQSGFEVTVANFSRTGHRKAAAKIAALKPDVVGISLFTHNRVDSLKLARAVKKELPRSRIVAGGPHATHLASEIVRRVPEIDYIIPGEGEVPLKHLLKKIEAGRPPKNRIIEPETIEDLDTIPAPHEFGGALIDIDPNEQLKNVITTRGCPHDCSFCCSPAFWKRKVRFRSPAHILKEAEALYRKNGIIYFSIRDDNFTLNKERVLEFADLLKKSGVYLMWNCQSRVDTIDEEMLIAMKRAGLEHIQYGVESGSEKILKEYNKHITIEKIRHAAKITRRTGVYLSIYLMTGMKNETAADTAKTKSLIRSILPGDGIVSPVALYPGTRLYEEELSSGAIHDSIWFQRGEAGIFLRNDPQVAASMRDLLNELSIIREKSWYREADFQRHRAVTGTECWVTDILEGDYHLDEENHELAERSYLRVITAHPDNPWGFLRMGKLKFRTSEFESAAENYSMVTRLVPAYYGGWLKLAESHIARGERTLARNCVAEAYRLNRFDLRVKNLKDLVK